MVVTPLMDSNMESSTGIPNMMYGTEHTRNIIRKAPPISKIPEVACRTSSPSLNMNDINNPKVSVTAIGMRNIKGLSP